MSYVLRLSGVWSEHEERTSRPQAGQVAWNVGCLNDEKGDSSYPGVSWCVLVISWWCPGGVLVRDIQRLLGIPGETLSRSSLTPWTCSVSQRWPEASMCTHSRRSLRLLAKVLAAPWTPMKVCRSKGDSRIEGCLRLLPPCFPPLDAPAIFLFRRVELGATRNQVSAIAASQAMQCHVQPCSAMCSHAPRQRCSHHTRLVSLRSTISSLCLSPSPFKLCAHRDIPTLPLSLSALPTPRRSSLVSTPAAHSSLRSAPTPLARSRSFPRNPTRIAPPSPSPHHMVAGCSCVTCSLNSP